MFSSLSVPEDPHPVKFQGTYRVCIVSVRIPLGVLQGDPVRCTDGAWFVEHPDQRHRARDPGPIELKAFFATRPTGCRGVPRILMLREEGADRFTYGPIWAPAGAPESEGWVRGIFALVARPAFRFSARQVARAAAREARYLSWAAGKAA